MSNPPLKLFLCITKSNWGGAQKYVYDIATGLPRDAFDVSVLLGGNGELKNRLEASGVHTTMLNNAQRDIDTKKEFALFFELVSLFKKEKPDIVHLNSSKMGFTGALAVWYLNGFGLKSKKSQIKCIFTAHGWAFNEDRGFLSRIAFKILHIITIILTDQTISVSETTRKQIPWPIRNKIKIVHNGLRPINFKDKHSARTLLIEKILSISPKASSTLARNPTWIGTVSELHTNKGLSYAIEALAQLQEQVIFVIIGEGEQRKKLQELIIKLGVQQKVFLVGRIEMAGELLKAFDIFTLTSITEAFPYALLETGAAGLPIVASRVGGIPEVIVNEKTGMLIAPRHPDEIRSALLRLIRNPKLAGEVGLALHQKVTQDFQLAEMLRKTTALYRI